jgi:hypothetical protein
MKVGKPLRVYTVEPVVDPVPRSVGKQPADERRKPLKPPLRRA